MGDGLLEVAERFVLFLAFDFSVAEHCVFVFTEERLLFEGERVGVVVIGDGVDCVGCVLAEFRLGYDWRMSSSCLYLRLRALEREGVTV